ncbi:MAG TPA: anaerobic glycerol-3-phosphate dehydrogenase subunit GlpA [Gaiellales bacterium]|nr:anaerobic glycerol-3-phosphate dehydrogenase subunit GlpA [Gaiellales bacterium]
MIETQVLVVGGGATGVGVARDAALRGLRVVLVERHDLAEGTTGRFHGLLHSGGRYVVKDPRSAKECMDENRILRRIAAHCIEDTGGLFVCTKGDDEEYAGGFMAACAEAGIEAEEIGTAEALRREPRLHPGLTRAFSVPDASVDTWKLVGACADDVERRGGTVLRRHEVVSLIVEGDAVRGARVRDARTGDEVEVRADITVSATGAWAGRVAAMAGCDVHVRGGRGIMVALNHRLTHAVVNRCRMPADSDILVPAHTVCVLGTTDVSTDDPEDTAVPRDEVRQMLADGSEMVPHIGDARVLRAWAGIRPLYSEGDTGAPTRDLTRDLTLLDHREREGVGGFLTITGGKLTTFRLMAEVTVDAVCEHLGVDAPCTTADKLLPGSEDGQLQTVGERLADRERNLHDEQIVCECELVTRGMLLDAAAARPVASLDDLRRATRLGMGPCQGGFCIPRAAGLLAGAGAMDAPAVNAAVRAFVEERWKGGWPILEGRQARQMRLDDWMFHGALDIGHLPG